MIFGLDPKKDMLNIRSCLDQDIGWHIIVMLENVFLEERASCLHKGTLRSVHCAVRGESEGPEQRVSLL